MKLKPITIALAVGASLMMTSCVNKAANERNTTNIFNIESQSDMAVTLYYDVEEPTITFITPGGTKISADSLPTDRDNGAVLKKRVPKRNRTRTMILPNPIAGRMRIFS